MTSYKRYDHLLKIERNITIQEKMGANASTIEEHKFVLLLSGMTSLQIKDKKCTWERVTILNTIHTHLRQ